MDKKVYDNYVKLLHDELTMATGCTEPIAIAYAGANFARCSVTYLSTVRYIAAGTS